MGNVSVRLGMNEIVEAWATQYGELDSTLEPDSPATGMSQESNSINTANHHKPEQVVMLLEVATGDPCTTITFQGANGHPNVTYPIAADNTYLFGPFDSARFVEAPLKVDDGGGQLDSNTKLGDGRQISFAFNAEPDAATSAQAFYLGTYTPDILFDWYD